MSELVMQTQNSPGAIGANLVAFFFDAAGVPSYVGNDAIAYQLLSNGAGNFVQTSTRNVFTKAQAVTPSATLANTGSTTLDGNLSCSFTIVGGQLTGNITIANPANLSDGQAFSLLLKQSTAGNHTVTYGSQFKFSNANEKVLTPTANAVDLISCQYFAAANIIVAGARQNVS